MKKILATTLCAAALLADPTLTLAAPGPRGPQGGPAPHRGPAPAPVVEKHHHDSTGKILAAGVIGAVIGAALTAPAEPAPVYTTTTVVTTPVVTTPTVVTPAPVVTPTVVTPAPVVVTQPVVVVPEPVVVAPAPAPIIVRPAPQPIVIAPPPPAPRPHHPGNWPEPAPRRHGAPW